MLSLTAACGGGKTSASPSVSPPPLLVDHARLLDSDGDNAILVDKGRIQAVGPSAHVRAQAPAGVRTVDAAGAQVLPGFHDSHVHLMSGGMSGMMVDLAPLQTMEAVQQALREHAAAHAADPWVTGRGWQYGIVPPGQFPKRQQLDAVVPDRPVYLVSYDGHSGWCNTKALDAAGIGPGTADPEGGRIVREAGAETPQGALLEDAQQLVIMAMPKPSRETQLNALAGALQHLAGLGFTSVEEIAPDPGELDLLRTLEEQGKLPLHVGVALPLQGDLVHYGKLRQQFATERLRVTFLKGFLDGVIESRTAWMLAPYEGTAERGAPVMPPAQFAELVDAAHAARFPVAAHAIGDASVRSALDSFEAAIAKHPGIKLRHRIEHMEVVDPLDLARFKKLDVIASVQPFHANPGGPNPDAEVWSRNLGEQRRRMSFAWNSVLAAGGTLAFGTDWPVMSANPLWGLAMATTRRTGKGEPAGGWNAHQAVTPGQAVDAFTRGSAYAVGAEREVGQLLPGQRADLVVLEPGVDVRKPGTLWPGKVRYVVVSGEPRVIGPE